MYSSSLLGSAIWEYPSTLFSRVGVLRKTRSISQLFCPQGTSYYVCNLKFWKMSEWNVETFGTDYLTCLCWPKCQLTDRKRARFFYCAAPVLKQSPALYKLLKHAVCSCRWSRFGQQYWQVGLLSYQRVHVLTVNLAISSVFSSWFLVF